MNKLERIVYISNGYSLKEQEKNICTALDAGISWIQLRWKHFKHFKEQMALAQLVKKLCEQYQACYIINDHIDIAKEIDADGVHLGLDDDPIAVARIELGASKIIGGTANTYPDVLQRNREGCDYIGLGPLRFTETKRNLSPVLGITGYQNIAAMLREDRINTVPIYAIGGVAKDDIPKLLSADVYGVAISEYITSNPQAVKKMKAYYEEFIKHS